MNLPTLAICASALVSLPFRQDETQPGWDATERVLELSLEDAVRMVLESNLDLEVQALDREISRFQSLGSWGRFDPIFEMSGTLVDSEEQDTQSRDPFTNQVFTSLGVDSETRTYQQSLGLPLLSGGRLDVTHDIFNFSDEDGGAFNRSNLAIGLTQPLLRGSGVAYATADQRIAELEFHLQVERERQSRQDLVLSVHEGYWNLVEAIEEVTVREFTLRLGEEQLEQDRRRLDVGVGTEVDVLQAETNVATNEEQLLLAGVERAAAMDTLKSLLFRQDGDDFGAYIEAWNVEIQPLTGLPDVEETESLEWTRSLGRALSRRSQLAQRRLETHLDELRLHKAKKEALPGLELFLQAKSVGDELDSTDALSESVTYDFPEYTASLRFDFPTFNRQAHYARRAARVQLIKSRLSYDQSEQEVVADVRARVRDMNYQSKAVQAAKKSLELAERQLDAEQARYDEGLSTTFQVLEFQEDLAQALSAEKSARAAYARAQAGLIRAEGWLSERAQP